MNVDESSYHGGAAEAESSAAAIGEEESLRRKMRDSQSDAPNIVSDEDRIVQVEVDESSTGASVLLAMEQAESLETSQQAVANNADDLNAWTTSNIAVLNELLSKRNQTRF